MSEDDAPMPEPDLEILVAPEPEALATLEVAFVVPPDAYDSITTESPTEPEPEPEPEPLKPQPEPIDHAPTVGAITALGQELNQKLDALKLVFERELRAESTREKVVDRLHAELQEYKQGLMLSILKPVLVDLIQLHDDIGKMVDAQTEPDPARLLDLMRGYQQGIEDILYRQGVESFSVEGEAFDPRRQRALSTVPTEDAALNKQVAARLRKGFQAGDKMIRPEMVKVHAYKAVVRDPG